ncbi:MAG: cobyric acid synthase [Methanomassiliicoccales archaeon]|nr:cobyric acid synthase [Methanomassiliicoccales archaeon]
MTMRKLMVQGVTSGAGKTTLTAALCRHFFMKGMDVVPFKAQNVSLNSFVTDDGGEIAISQAYQAWASGIEPTRNMNPVLIKPKGSGQCQIVLDGRPWKDIGRGGTNQEMIEEIRSHILRSFDDLCLGRDMVVIEGMGSPVEMNLKDRDVSNMWLAKAVRSPVVLVGDIEKGGVFAGIYGTYLLMDEEERDLLKGFVINRFRGDASILGAGIEELESRMEMPCLGVLPYVRFSSPQEDSMDLRQISGGVRGEGDVRQRWIKELDGLLEKWEGTWDLSKVEGLVDRV